MTNRIAVDDGSGTMWIVDLNEWRRVLEAHGWTAWPRAGEWVWEEPAVPDEDDPGAQRYPYNEACQAYGGTLQWWPELTEEERDAIQDFAYRPDLGGEYWLAPFGPSEE